ncbi:ADP-ribosylation factor-like protein 4A isoform X1 [Glossina fuscipes]|uniref:small monomeric GTPase n=1 Tax=Glossina fuscipes TaxID=7396 RepID=A0A9C5ZHG2_9MUSC|nr:ADP-ribosylation factor-like protein 4A isoform X1 [Glossina fuscipes]
MGTTMGKNGGHFLDALPSQATLHVVMLGLDSAGKTTALYRLKFDQYLNTVPTIGFNCEKIQGTAGRAKGIHFLIWDVGGQEKLRPLWRSYTRCTDGILFVVDSVDVERMEEAKMELLRMAKCPDNQQFCISFGTSPNTPTDFGRPSSVSEWQRWKHPCADNLCRKL